MANSRSVRETKYKTAQQHARHILTLFYEARKNNWSAQSVASIFSDIFSLADKNQWYPGSTEYTGKEIVAEQDPYWDVESIGESILLHVALLSDDAWIDGRPNLITFKRLKIYPWPKPNFDELPSGGSSFVERLEKIDPDVRKANRLLWNELAKHLDYLQSESSMAVFECDPYSTPIFRFNKSLFRDQLWRSSRYEFSHPKIIEFVFSPLYFSSIYELKSLVQIRIVRKKSKAKGVSSRKNIRSETHEPIERCKLCGRVLSDRKRGDSETCGDGCRNQFNRLNRK